MLTLNLRRIFIVHRVGNPILVINPRVPCATHAQLSQVALTKATRIYTESWLLKMGVFSHKCSELNMILNLEIIQLLHSRESSGQIIISSLK